MSWNISKIFSLEKVERGRWSSNSESNLRLLASEKDVAAAESASIWTSGLKDVLASRALALVRLLLEAFVIWLLTALIPLPIPEDYFEVEGLG